MFVTLVEAAAATEVAATAVLGTVKSITLVHVVESGIDGPVMFNPLALVNPVFTVEVFALEITTGGNCTVPDSGGWFATVPCAGSVASLEFASKGKDTVPGGGG